jgi:hypothetical protein
VRMAGHSVFPPRRFQDFGGLIEAADRKVKRACLSQVTNWQG